MTPRAVRPARASTSAAVLLEARLVVWATPVMAADRIFVSTFTVPGQTRRRMNVAGTSYPTGGDRALARMARPARTPAGPCGTCVLAVAVWPVVGNAGAGERGVGHDERERDLAVLRVLA